MGYTQGEAAEILKSADGFPMDDEDLDAVTGGVVMGTPPKHNPYPLMWYYTCSRCGAYFSTNVTENNPSMACPSCGGLLILTKSAANK